MHTSTSSSLFVFDAHGNDTAVESLTGQCRLVSCPCARRCVWTPRYSLFDCSSHSVGAQLLINLNYLAAILQIVYSVGTTEVQYFQTFLMDRGDVCITITAQCSLINELVRDRRRSSTSQSKRIHTSNYILVNVSGWNQIIGRSIRHKVH